MFEQIVSSGLIFGLISMVGWGAGDFFSALSARKLDSINAFLWIMTVAAVVFGVILLSI